MPNKTFEDGVAAMRDQVLGIMGFYGATRSMCVTDRALFDEMTADVQACAESSADLAPVKHPDDAVVDRFAGLLREQMVTVYAGVPALKAWRYMQPRDLWTLLRSSAERGEATKAAFICMMICHNRAAIGAAQEG
jgi:hypothetical protein